MHHETAEITDDLLAEQQALDDVVTDFSLDQWVTATASPGWTVADQIAHLTYFDASACLALLDPERFADQRVEFMSSSVDPNTLDAMTLGEFRRMTSDQLLTAWRRGRTLLANAATAADSTRKVEWYGPPMSLRSFLAARLMEVWAHGQDVVDATGRVRRATDRLRHVAHLGVITRTWSYRNRGLDVPHGDVRVVLVAPSGREWLWGPNEARDTVSGSAEDFCLVVTQRRHVDDTSLDTSGPLAREWMALAQAFAGPPTTRPARYQIIDGERA